ncbi:MAG: hypothetical protein PVH37_07045 [Desulfobacterales bacterium]
MQKDEFKKDESSLQPRGLFNLYYYQGHVVILANASGVIFQGFENGIKDILCAKPVVASDEILKPLFPKHVLVAVSNFPDAIRSNRDHLTRAQPCAGRDRISSGSVYD